MLLYKLYDHNIFSPRSNSVCFLSVCQQVIISYSYNSVAIIIIVIISVKWGYILQHCCSCDYLCVFAVEVLLCHGFVYWSTPLNCVTICSCNWPARSIDLPAHRSAKLHHRTSLLMFCTSVIIILRVWLLSYSSQLCSDLLTQLAGKKY